MFCVGPPWHFLTRFTMEPEMAKYRIGDQRYYSRAGVLYQPETEITLRPGEEPSRTWTPLDKEAEAALEKLRRGDAERERLYMAKSKDFAGVDVEALIQRRVDAAVKAATANLAAAKAEPEEVPAAPSRVDKAGKREADKAVL